VKLERSHWLVLSLIGLALAASLTSLHNGFAYDDQPIIVANPHVQSLAGFGHRFVETYWPAKDSAGLYRPLTILLFALQWAIGGGGPFVFHLVNVLLYAALTAVVYSLARQLLPEAVAWLAAALFAVDPVHVEAVANGVGQSELTAALAAVSAVTLYLRWRRAAPLQPLSGAQSAWLAGLYLAACGTKEHGVVLPALLLLAEVTVMEDPRPARTRQAALFPAFALLTGIGVGFLALRGWVLRDISPDIKAVSLLPLSTGQRVMTMVALAPQWLRLLFWPAHLQADYAPLETPIITSFQPSVGLGALLLGAGLALGVLVRRRRPVVAFGVGWIAITLLPVSNLLITSGQVLAERTMMLPSVGAVVVVGALAAGWMATGGATAQARKLVGTLAGIVVLAGGLRSAQRQPVWASDESLMSQTVLDAPRSHWAQWIYGDWLFVHGKPAEGERHMRLAVQLYPGNPYILRILGGRYQENGLCQAAVPLFQHALELRPGWWEVQLRLAACFQTMGRPDQADQVVSACLAPGGAQVQLQALLDQNQGHPGGSGPPRR
jgi:hypothetical protein